MAWAEDELDDAFDKMFLDIAERREKEEADRKEACASGILRAKEAITDVQRRLKSKSICGKLDAVLNVLDAAQVDLKTSLEEHGYVCVR